MVGATEQTQTSVRFKQQAETLYIFEFTIPGAHAFYSSTSEIYALILFKRPMDDVNGLPTQAVDPTSRVFRSQ